jgi:hypothetical protein
MWSTCFWAIGGMKIGRANRSTGRTPTPAPICPPHEQTRTLTRAAEVESQRLIAWAMARPNMSVQWLGQRHSISGRGISSCICKRVKNCSGYQLACCELHIGDSFTGSSQWGVLPTLFWCFVLFFMLVCHCSPRTSAPDENAWNYTPKVT